MKTLYITCALLFLFNIASAQVAIGKTTVNGSSTLLDFDDSTGNTSGIILPAIADRSTAASTADNNGTFIFDKSDNKVKMYENNIWTSLSDDAGDGTLVANQNNTSSETGNGVIIGASSSNAKGILILESTTKAMILPRIHQPELNVKSPYPGMMCYDTSSMSLAVYDGVRWNYWK